MTERDGERETERVRESWFEQMVAEQMVGRRTTPILNATVAAAAATAFRTK